jgi:hypothetical protein
MTLPFPAMMLAARLLLPGGPTAPPDPCALVSANDIAAALGAKPAPGRPHGPSVDEDTGARVWSCGYGVGKGIFSIGFAEFRTPAEAAAALRETARLAAEDKESIQLTPEPGLGDAALWGSNDDGAIWVVHRGKYMLNVTLGGGGGNQGRLRDGLRRLALAALAKL